MKLRFLCPTHRVHLSLKPEQAINCWQNGFDTGQTFFEQELWEEALPHIGCAFETSEIIMTTKAVEPEFASELFTFSATQLANTFIKLGYVEQCREVYWMAINRLERELSYRAEKQVWINIHLRYLYRGIQHLESTDGQSDLGTPLFINTTKSKGDPYENFFCSTI